MKKKIVAAIIAIVCIVAILVVCAIMFKPEDNKKDPSDTSTETESVTFAPGYIETEEQVFPEIGDVD